MRNAPKYVTDLPDTAMNRRILLGHSLRKNHTPDVLHVSLDGVLWTKVYRCCGESIPALVSTWDALVPDTKN